MADSIGGANYSIGADRNKREDQRGVVFRSALTVGLTASVVAAHFIFAQAQVSELGRAWIKGTPPPQTAIADSVPSRYYESDAEPRFAGTARVFGTPPASVALGTSIYRSVLSVGEVKTTDGAAQLTGPLPSSADAIYRTTGFTGTVYATDGVASLTGVQPPAPDTYFRPLLFVREVRSTDGAALLTGQQPPALDAFFRSLFFAREVRSTDGSAALSGQMPPPIQIIPGPSAATITVRAFALGYIYDQFRNIGDTFSITDPYQYSPYWMTFVDSPPADWLPFLSVFDAYIDREMLEFGRPLQ